MYHVRSLSRNLPYSIRDDTPVRSRATFFSRRPQACSIIFGVGPSVLYPLLEHRHAPITSNSRTEGDLLLGHHRHLQCAPFLLVTMTDLLHCLFMGIMPHCCGWTISSVRPLDAIGGAHRTQRIATSSVTTTVANEINIYPEKSSGYIKYANSRKTLACALKP